MGLHVKARKARALRRWVWVRKNMSSDFDVIVIACVSASGSEGVCEIVRASASACAIGAEIWEESTIGGREG